MHARELLELTAVLASHSPLLVEYAGALPEESLRNYWSASRCRLDRWGQRLKQLSEQASDTGASALERLWPYMGSVLEEIITGEALSRVFAAVLYAHDRRHKSDTAEPIARNVLNGHLEARWRVLRLLAAEGGVSVVEALRLDYLRRRVERWTDLLLGYLNGLCNIENFAHNPERVADFAQDFHSPLTASRGRQTWSLVQASFRTAFRHGLFPISPNADLNQQIAAGVLSCFPAEVFHDTGLPRSLWSLRIYQTTNEAQGMIDELLSSGPAPSSAARADLNGQRWRNARQGDFGA